MIREAEPRRIPSQSFELVDQATAAVRPDDSAMLGWFEKYVRQHRHRLAVDLWLVRQHIPAGSRILECGSVPLILTAALADLDYRLDGVDIDPTRFADSIQSIGLDVAGCDLEREALPFADDSFDAVLFNEIFEHLRINPIFTLGEVSRVLKPGGTLILSTPNLRSFRGIANLLLRDQAHAASADVYRQYEKLETLGHMGHVREYTATEVTTFLARLGFATESLFYRGGHGRGIAGFMERTFPTMRPFVSVIARRVAT